MIRPAVSLSGVALVCLLAVLPGCGGGSPSAPTVTTVVAQGTFHLDDLVSADAAGRTCDALAIVPLTTTATGTLAVTVDWLAASNNLDIGVERGSCTCNSLVAGQCDDIAFSTSATAKPETLSISSLAAGTYTLAIANNGPGTEAGSYQAFLTH